ncbi:thioesterase II family protein [Streptomyces acidiscabies]|uniref:thioesterase II family protein n=1 Tax=Streptomyces acidiscabies TaxID=42234 RepID=UPI00073F3D57|nr:alpha/beta fold hydrolase [Streptomyces acidiscabies]GAQ52592.1 phenyloxazoline synthase MbtB [Streptomyces acidiscabies]
MEMNDDGRWIRRFAAAEDAPYRVVCFPHAGGSASYFLPVAKALAPGAEVLAIQYPGRQDRRHEAGVTSIVDLAGTIASVLLPRWLDRPTVLFGHSMGASVAFEVARRLERAGTVPLALFVSGRVAPTRIRPETVHLRDDAGLLAEVRKLSGTDERVFGDDELVRLFLPTLRSDYTAVETYRFIPGPLLDTPIHAHLGDADPRVTPDEAADWREQTNGPFTLRTYTGGHFYLNAHSAQVIQAITEALVPASPYRV